MLKRLTKGIMFWKTPKKTYAFLHPFKTARVAGAAGVAGALVAAKLVFDRVRR